MAGGVLYWAPQAFWDATYWELTTAYLGYCKANRLGPWSGRVGSAWTEEQVEAVRINVERLKALHPDGRPTDAVMAALKEQRRAQERRHPAGRSADRGA